MILFNDWHWNFGVFKRKDEEFLFEYNEKTSDFVLNQEILTRFGKNKQKLVESDFQEAKKESVKMRAALAMLECHEEVTHYLLDVNMYDLLEVHDKTDFRFMMHLNHTYNLNYKNVSTEQK